MTARDPQTPKPLTFVLADASAGALGLNMTDKAVLRALVDRMNSKRNGTEVWPSIDYLADRTGGSLQTIRRSLHRLAGADGGHPFIKVRTDSGKSNVYTINAELIRALSDPCQIGRGEKVDPYQNGRGTPAKVEGDPCQIGTRTAKELAQGNSKEVFPIGCSTSPKVGDGPEQRKLAVHGIVAGASKRMQSPAQEQPTDEKAGRAHGTTSIGALAVKERPG